MPARLGHTVVLALAVVVAASACAPTVRTRGHVIDEAAVSGFEAGTTTRDDVLASLGSPSSVNTFGDETWYYIQAVTESTAFFDPELKEQKVVAIVFDGSGVVSAVNHYGMDDRWDLTLVERETPTHGKRLGLLQQLLGNVGRFTKEAGGTGQ
ncbi:MAG: outer membrane protein assembly factor BamE [Alphaproteobacteria bacterium]